MRDLSSHSLFIDGFCGGGGASTGIERALRRPVDVAVNHDPLAVAVHKANHPTTEHHCQDIRAVWPTHATKLRPVAGAWFSPDCKEHSKAKGGPVKDRNIRALPWEIVTWLKDVRPTVTYVENVEEMQQWGPLDENGWVIKDLRGKEFKRWIRACRALGYRVEHRELRACDYGAPTSRKRLYIIMRCDGLPIVWPKPTHGRRGTPAVLAGRLQPYRTAADCIDWSVPVRSIFGRKKDLADNTLRRVAHGIMRYVVNAAEPFIVPVTHSGSATRVHGIAADPLRTITTANGGELALVDATLAPHITKFHSGSVGSDMQDAMPTVTGNGNAARPAGAAPLGIVGATLVQQGYGERPGQSPRVPHLDKPLGAIVAGGGKHAVVQAEAVFLDRQFGKSSAAPVSAPIGAVTAGGGGKTAQVSAFMSRFQGSNRTASAGDLQEPAGTAMAGGQHQAIVCAHIEQANGGPRNTKAAGHPIEKPLSTATTTGSQQRVVQTTLIEADALPPGMMESATRVAAFLIKYYGSAIGQTVDQPFDTVTTKPRFAVVTVTIDAVTYVIVDIGLRMLTPRELARAQGFPDSYVLDPIVAQMERGKLVMKPLSKAAQIRMIGNSVCPDVADALIAANQPECQEWKLAA